MCFDTVLIEKKDKMGILTLNRPQKFNTFIEKRQPIWKGK